MVSEFSKPYRLDGNSHGGGILVYFMNNITAKLLKLEYTTTGYRPYIY